MTMFEEGKREIATKRILKNVVWKGIVRKNDLNLGRGVRMKNLKIKLKHPLNTMINRGIEFQIETEIVIGSSVETIAFMKIFVIEIGIAIIEISIIEIEVIIRECAKEIEGGEREAGVEIACTEGECTRCSSSSF